MSCRTTRRRGMSLPEVLMALTISSGLLVAVGVAFQASTQAASQTEQFYRSLQTARQSVNRIVGEVRRCQSVLVAPDQLLITTPTATELEYVFDRTARTLLLKQPMPPPKDILIVALAKDVEDVRFATDGTSVTMQVTVRVGSNSVTLTGSALPRRAVNFR